MTDQSITWADLLELGPAEGGGASTEDSDSSEERLIVRVLKGAAAAGWDLVYGPRNAFAVLAGPSVDPQVVRDPAAGPADSDDWGLAFIAVPQPADGATKLAGPPPLRIEFDWTEEGGVYASFRVRGLVADGDGADGVRANGWVCWASGSLITWHIHDPCRHGWRELDKPLPEPFPEDLPEGAFYDSIAWATIAGAVSQEVARGLSAPAARVSPSTDREDRVDPPTLEELRAIGTRYRMRESRRAHRYRGYSGSDSNWWPQRLDDLDVLEGAAEAGWDVAIGPEDGTYIILRGPGGASPTAECVPTPASDAWSSLDRGEFTLSYEPGIDSPFNVTLEVLERCAAGGIIAYSADVPDTPDASPGTSCPFWGWASVIGDDVIVTNYCDDLEMLRAARGRVDRARADLRGPRALAILSRAIVFLAFDRGSSEGQAGSVTRVRDSQDINNRSAHAANGDHAPSAQPVQPGGVTQSASLLSPATTGTGPALQMLLDRWPEIVEVLSESPQIKTLILACRPVGMAGTVVTLGFPEDQAFYKDVAERRRALLEDGVSRVLGTSVSVQCVPSLLVPDPSEDPDGARLVSEFRRLYREQH